MWNCPMKRAIAMDLSAFHCSNWQRITLLTHIMGTRVTLPPGKDQ